MAAGLSLIFGVTRIVNFATARSTCWAVCGPRWWSGCWACIGFWPALLLAPLATGVLGAVVEMALLRCIYRAPELLQLLATFALVLVVKDAVLWAWGPEELFGPARRGLEGSGGHPGAAVSQRTTCC